MPGENKGILGSIAGIFDKGPKIKAINYNNRLAKYIARDLLPSAQEDLANRRTAQNLFQQRLTDATPEAQRISALRTGYLERGLADTENFDAFNSLYRPLGDYLFGQMNAVAPAAVGLTKGADDARRIGLGIRPGGYSSYVDAARTRDIGDILSRNFSDVLRTIGTDTSRLLSSRAGERATGLSLLDNLSAEPDRLAYRELQPAYVGQELLAGDIENADRLVNSYKNNVAGFKSTPSTWGRVSEGLGGIYNSVIESAQTAASLYGSVMGGGAGGMLGGMGGGGGGASPVPTGFNSTGQNWTGAIGPTMGGSPFRTSSFNTGSGGIDTATLLQLVQLLRGNQNPYLNAGSQINPYMMSQQYAAPIGPIPTY